MLTNDPSHALYFCVLHQPLAIQPPHKAERHLYLVHIHIEHCVVIRLRRPGGHVRRRGQLGREERSGRWRLGSGGFRPGCTRGVRSRGRGRGRVVGLTETLGAP
jgi:hypothetical protein